MYFEKYPIGPPDRIAIMPDLSDLQTFFGLAKVRVLPPSDLHVAVLPYREKKGDKLHYTLCRTCSIEQNRYTCLHTEKERCFVGTYTSFELKIAMSKNYKVLKCFEIWGWNRNNRSSDLFKDYIKTFFEIKIASDGFPADVLSDEQKDIYCANVNEINQLDILRENVSENVGLRTTAKALLNSLWGKLTIRPGKPKCVYIIEAKEYFDLLRNEAIEITNIYPVSERMIHVSFVEKDMMPSSFTNVVIGSMVTSYARCWLFTKCIDLLDAQQLLYVDTDSIVFVEKAGLPTLTLENQLGGLTDEIQGNYKVEDHIGIWCATGNKSYSFQLKNNPHIRSTKVKGFTLDLSCNFENDVNFKRMLDMILSEKTYTLNLQQPPLFVKDKENAHIYTKDRSKVFKFAFDNKVILDSYQTRPYGFVGIFPQIQ